MTMLFRVPENPATPPGIAMPEFIGEPLIPVLR
jgi:hypothetical protein